MAKILIVDNEMNVLTILGTVLKAEGYETIATKEAEKAKEILNQGGIDLVLSDIRMSPVNGMELLRWTKAEHSDVSVIMLTAYGSVETAIEAMKLGAFDYVTKPFKVDELLLTLQRALDYKRALAENSRLKAQFKTRYRFENIVAESPAMKTVCELIDRVAPTDTTVLIYGESGTGKELVAKAVHAYSRRKNAKFLAINCAALPEALLESEMFGHVKGAFTGASVNKKGLFEAADGGTIFLDEIGEIPLGLQAKLLRVINDGSFCRMGSTRELYSDARVLASTSRDLEALIAAGRFRDDLFYRLNVMELHLPPLREHPEDILPLATHFISRFSHQKPRFSASVATSLLHYRWPGNARELRNAMERAALLSRGEVVLPEHLPARILAATAGATQAGAGDAPRLEEIEREAILKALRKNNYNRTETAKELAISRRTLIYKLQRLRATGTPVDPAPTGGG
jgi:DNA-binding NtrC family response regulator